MVMMTDCYSPDMNVYSLKRIITSSPLVVGWFHVRAGGQYEHHRLIYFADKRTTTLFSYFCLLQKNPSCCGKDSDKHCLVKASPKQYIKEH